MFIRKLIIGLLSFYVVDVKQLQNKKFIFPISSFAIELVINRESKKRKEKRREKRYRNSKYQPRTTYKIKSIKLKGTHAKDQRFSNQNKLRRMYRNS